MIEKKNKKIPAYLTGNDAEDFVEYFSKRTFLKQWVFRNPRSLDNDEFSDVVIIFRDTIILIEVKGNQFDPRNPQRYLKEAQKRHQQLKHAERIILRRSKKVKFENEYFSYVSNFSEIKKIYLVSVSTGPGEMEIAFDSPDIDYSKIDVKKVGKYLGFYNQESNIHSFTGNELIFASKHLDTFKDFFWYLDFEKKFLSSDFKSQRKGQGFISIVDTHREDLISIYILNYYWDEELNRTGKINLNKILGSANTDKADMIMYIGTDTRKHLETDEVYKKISKEKKISYFWDNLISYAISNYSFAYKLTSETKERQNIGIEDLKNVLEEMSNTSRLERVIFSERIKEVDDKGHISRNMFSLAEDADTLISYARIDYKTFPNQEEQEKRSYSHLYGVWCRIKFGDKLKDFRDKIKQSLLITRHVHKDQSALTFALSTEIAVDENLCKEIGMIP
jgi:hypothetical protein